MRFRSWLIIGLIMAPATLMACSTHTLGTQQTTDTPTQVPVPTPTPTHSTDARQPAAGPPRLFTYADNDQTIILALGERFALQLGPSAGSPWQVEVEDPAMIQPTLRQIGATGYPVTLEVTRAGKTKIIANSHIICVGHGPCPEVTTFFTLNVQVPTEYPSHLVQPLDHCQSRP